jgi:signal transduction histidine kinase/ActR/RegA family two-component response regulator
LARNEIACLVCADVHELTTEVNRGAMALIMTERALTDRAIGKLLAALEAQPSWSDLPTVLLLPGAALSAAGEPALQSLRNVTLLERPVAMRTLLSAVQAAMRGRARQYQMREQLQALQRAEALARAAQAQGEQASRMKDEFLATLSHELRTPLNAILGWSQLIRQRPDAQMIEEGLSIIERNTRVQVQLIEDLLDMSRIISGKLRLDFEIIDIATFIDAAIETVGPAAKAKGVELRRVVIGKSFVGGDANRLQQVIWNLLSNAIKFTPAGGHVEVRAGRHDSRISISVADSGQGIKSEFLPHAFERFRQADGSTTRPQGGLGLGLAIVKNLVELHGGTVEACSAGENQGSTFTIMLPAARLDHPSDHRLRPPDTIAKAPDLGRESLSGLKVLVVDDEPDARDLLRRLLERRHATVITAGSAIDGLQLLQQEKPDVLVSDIGMPMVDGYEFITQVRSLGAEHGGDLPAIALTAFARADDRARALRAGYTVHLSKPVEPANLIAIVASVTGRAGAIEELGR